MRFPKLLFAGFIAIVSFASIAEVSQAQSLKPSRNVHQYVRNKSAQSLTQKIGTNEITSTFNAFLRATKLDQKLATGDFTVFVPTNKAFNYLSPTPENAQSVEMEMAQLVHPDNRQELTKLISSLIVEGTVNFQTLKVGGEMSSIDGGVITCTSIEDGVITLKSTSGNTAKIEARLVTTNGIVVLTDRVLLPTHSIDEVKPVAQQQQKPSRTYRQKRKPVLRQQRQAPVVQKQKPAVAPIPAPEVTPEVKPVTPEVIIDSEPLDNLPEQPAGEE